jgi:hypothetical protein
VGKDKGRSIKKPPRTRRKQRKIGKKQEAAGGGGHTKGRTADDERKHDFDRQ